MTNYFTELNAINVNGHTEKRKGTGSKELTYLSWTWAVSEILKKYPDMQYEIKKFTDKDGVLKPYMYDENTGYMVETSVTIAGITRTMWLPVMDSANKAMKNEKYTYQVKEYVWDSKQRKNVATGKMIDKEVEAATMFDVNKAIMRCLTKNLAMFGLGLYIYAGEDLPEEDKENEVPEKTRAEKAKETREKTAAEKERALEEGKKWYEYCYKAASIPLSDTNRIHIENTIAVLDSYKLYDKKQKLLELYESKAEKDGIPDFKPEEYLQAG